MAYSVPDWVRHFSSVSLFDRDGRSREYSTDDFFIALTSSLDGLVPGGSKGTFYKCLPQYTAYARTAGSDPGRPFVASFYPNIAVVTLFYNDFTEEDRWFLKPTWPAAFNIRVGDRPRDPKEYVDLEENEPTLGVGYDPYAELVKCSTKPDGQTGKNPRRNPHVKERHYRR